MLKYALLKTGKTEPFKSHPDVLAVNTWLYKVDMSLNILVLENLQLLLEESEKITYASSLLKGNEENCWYMLIRLRQAFVN